MIRLGTEIELHVINNPLGEDEFTTDYPIVHAHNKAAYQGYTHYVNGNFVREIHQGTDDFFRVSYDATAAFGKAIWNGFEIQGEPADLATNLDYWSRLYNKEIKQYLAGDPDYIHIPNAPAHHSCGMHVHLSAAELNRNPDGFLIVRNMSKFVADPDNKSLLSCIAGRYNTQWCPVKECDEYIMRNLYHLETCDLSNLKIDKSILPGYARGFIACCESVNNLNLHRPPRGAINLLPNPNTGDVEIRMFASPDDKSTLLARLEFSHALVVYCHGLAVGQAQGDFCTWLQSSRERRGEYRNLFRLLRDRGFVEGLIPRRRN